MRRETNRDKGAIRHHFAQKRAECAEAFQTALERELLDRETVNGLGSILCGDATIDYLVLSNAAPIAEQYAASVYDRVHAQQPVWPFTNKKECPDPNKAREHYVAAYEAYSQQQTLQALLAFYKDQYLVGRAYIAATAVYLTREEKDPKKREKERPLWKIFWNDLKKQKHTVCLTDPEFAAVLRDEQTRNALETGYREIYTVGRTARDILITKFHAFAYNQAKKYRRSEFTMDELVQEATIGLERATERYDYKRGILFQTYAKWWTKVMLRRLTDSQRHVRIPRQLQEAADLLGLIERDMRQKSAYEPSEADLLNHLCTFGYNKKVARDALNILRQRTISLDQESTDEEGSTPHDFIPDPHERDLTEEISQHCLAQDMKQAVACLEPRLRTVIEYRFQINDAPLNGKGKDGLVSLTEIGVVLARMEGREHPYTRERVRQLEGEAFEALRKILEGRPEFAYVQSELEQE